MQLQLKNLRTGKGLSQRDIAQCAGVQPAAVSKWENGENQLKLSEAVKIVRYLDCTLDDLAGIKPRELSHESQQHQALERAWAGLSREGRAKLLEYARLLALDKKNVE